MKKQEITSLIAITTLALTPGFLYLLSLRLSNLIFHTASFSFIGDLSVGIIASILLLTLTFILDVHFRRLKITGITEATMTTAIAFLSMWSFTFLIYQHATQAALTSLMFTFFSLAYAYVVKTRYERLTANEEKS